MEEPRRQTGHAAAGRVAALALLLSAAPAAADDPPVLMLSHPLAVQAGEKAEVTFRGLRLDAATGVSVSGPDGPVPATLGKHEKSAPPGQLKAEQVGDTVAVVELTPPADLAEPVDVRVAVETPAGKSEPVPLRVVPAERLVAEREENDGFASAQPVSVGRTVAGACEKNKDVDVYRFDGRAGQAVRVEILSARRGSPLDPIVTVYEARLSAVGFADDADGRDPAVTVTPAADGPLFVVVSDAHESNGSPAHVYLLELAPARP